jgi:hypothetical protein
MESEVKKANSDMATRQQDVEFWQSCTKLWQKFMWEYSRTLERSVQEIDKMEMKWSPERRYLVTLCRRYIPEEASERFDLNQLLQYDDSADELEVDVDLELLVDIYSDRLRELKAKNENLEQECRRHRSSAILAGSETEHPNSTVPMRASHVREQEHTGGRFAGFGIAGPSSAPRTVVPRDTEAFNHVTNMYKQTRDLMLELFTANAVPWQNGKRADWQTAR